MIRAQGPAQGAELVPEGGLSDKQRPCCGDDQRDNRGLSRSEDRARRGRDCCYLFYGLFLLNYLQVVFQSFSYGMFIYTVCVILVLSN